MINNILLLRLRKYFVVFYYKLISRIFNYNLPFEIIHTDFRQYGQYDTMGFNIITQFDYNDKHWAIIEK